MEVFAAMGSQWNVAPMGGIIGLRYEAIPFVMKMMSVARPDWPEVFGALRIMEREAVRCVRKDR